MRLQAGILVVLRWFRQRSRRNRQPHFFGNAGGISSPLISTEESVTTPSAPEQTPSASPARAVRISFVPPPLEGSISLGVYDKTGKLVRILHAEANLSEFTIGADALVTQWDGKNDDAEDLPTGKYRARGYWLVLLKCKI
jgi:hypothetical protein